MSTKPVPLHEAATWPADRLAALSTAELARLMAELKTVQAFAKAAAARLKEGLETKFGARVAGERTAKAKPFGRITIADTGQPIFHEVEKEVVWDQALLAALAAGGLAAQGFDPAELLRTTYAVDERAYAGWPSSLRALFDPARTVQAKGSKWELPTARAAAAAAGVYVYP